MNERGADEVEELSKCGRISYRLYCRTEGGGEVIAIMVQGRKRAEVVSI